jgi:hypothetical protein
MVCMTICFFFMRLKTRFIYSKLLKFHTNNSMLYYLISILFIFISSHLSRIISETFLLFLMAHLTQPIPVSVLSKAYVYGRCIAGIAGLNPAGLMVVFCVWCVCVGIDICDGYISRTGESHRVCVCVCVANCALSGAIITVYAYNRIRVRVAPKKKFDDERTYGNIIISILVPQLRSNLWHALTEWLSTRVLFKIRYPYSAGNPWQVPDYVQLRPFTHISC